MLGIRNISGISNDPSRLSFCKQCIRFKHRQLLSKMFPSNDVVVQRAHEKDKSSATDATGSLSQTLMLQNKLLLVASSGTFYILPSLMRALEKLYRVIDDGMQAIGAQKITMPCLSPKHIWAASKRWDLMGSELLTLKDRNGTQHCLSPTHEEAVTSIVAAESPVSYKRLPLRLYQIGRKFRDERRPKHGLLRCREFEMKDLYTFDDNGEHADETFQEVCQAYVDILTRIGLPHISVEASCGNMGGKKSKEFHLVLFGLDP
jgi:prolyl-tRNA synthetase